MKDDSDIFMPDAIDIEKVKSFNETLFTDLFKKDI